MGIIRNNFSHTSYSSVGRGFSPREVGQSWWDRVKRESNARIVRCGKVEKWVNHQKEEERKAKSSTNVRWPSNGSNAPPAQHSWKLRILRLVQRKWLPTPISRLLSPNPAFCHEDISEEKQGFSCDTICSLHGGRIYQWGVASVVVGVWRPGNKWDNMAPGLVDYYCPQDMSGSLQITRYSTFLWGFLYQLR